MDFADCLKKSFACICECLKCRPIYGTVGTRGVGFLTHTKKDLLLLSSRLYNVNEVLSMLEDDSSVQEASVFIEPPPVTEDTDEDSGEEDGEGTVSNLNGRQLRAPASATVVRNGQR